MDPCFSYPLHLLPIILSCIIGFLNLIEFLVVVPSYSLTSTCYNRVLCVKIFTYMVSEVRSLKVYYPLHTLLLQKKKTTTSTTVRKIRVRLTHFPTFENECECYSNILVICFLFLPLFLIFCLFFSYI